MSKRIVVVGGATAVAGLVLGASIVFGPDAIKNNRAGIDSDIAAPGIGTPGGRGTPDTSIRGFDITNIEVDDETGETRRVRIRADRFQYKPQAVTDLTRPRADIYLGARRAIVITADQADLLMDRDQPRAGTFSGNVVVTLFEAPSGTRLITESDDPAHRRFIQQRIYLDDKTDFSIEEDSIKTAGPVHATSRQVDFFGIGLNLSYNTQQKRIERLNITEGRYLLYNPEAKSPGFGATTGQAEQAEPDSEATTTRTRNDRETPTPTLSDREAPTPTLSDSEASGTDPQQPPAPAQFYAADFFGNVVVREGIESELGGDTLTLDFSLGTESISPEPFTPPPAEGDATSSSTLPRYLLASQTLFAQADATDADATDAIEPAQAAEAEPPAPLPLVAIPPRNAERSLFTHDPRRDVVVTWTGEMRIHPHATRPEPLADEDDVRVTLAGPNAYAQTTRNGELERLETGRLEYLRSQERTTAFARPNAPARILSEVLGGEITGQRITLRQQQGTATVLGPGRLNVTDQNDGKTLTLHWDKRLDLELYTDSKAPETNAKTATDADAERKEAPTPTPSNREAPTPTLSDSEASGTPTRTASQTRILGIKTATFDTAVTATHPDFDLSADKLTLAFREPDEAKDIGNHPTAINALGDVAVLARGDAEDERFDINAQRLSIDLKLDTDGEPYASAIRAVEAVDVRRPGSTLTCNRVEVELEPPSTTQAPTPPAKNKETTTPTLSDSEASGTPPTTPPQTPDKDRFAQVRSILAIGSVRAKLDYDDRRVDLVADTLLAEVNRDRLTLSSNTPRELAEVFDIGKQQKITGQTIVMDDQAEALDITGPGSLATRLSDPNHPDAGLEDAFLAINWTRAMSFSNITGKAEFYDNVRSESRRSTDTSELLCDQLVMQFSPDYKRDPHRLIEDEGKDNHERQVRSAVATGSVKFTASAFDPLDPDTLRNRTLLEGPKLVFTNTPATTIGQRPIETLFVDGKGHMLIEDYRPPDEKKTDDSVFVTGRGATLFTWEQSMLLNARSNTATLLDTVQMVHQPKDAGGQVKDVVTLNGEKLVADLTDTGGLSVWLSDDAPDAQISVITVDGGVRLRNSGRAMAGDHLKYLAETDTVTLWTDPGRDVVLQDLERDNSTRTNKVMWNLTQDRIEIDELRGGATPLE